MSNPGLNSVNIMISCAHTTSYIIMLIVLLNDVFTSQGFGDRDILDVIVTNQSCIGIFCFFGLCDCECVDFY